MFVCLFVCLFVSFFLSFFNNSPFQITVQSAVACSEVKHGLLESCQLMKGILISGFSALTAKFGYRGQGADSLSQCVEFSSVSKVLLVHRLHSWGRWDVVSILICFARRPE